MKQTILCILLLLCCHGYNAWPQDMTQEQVTQLIERADKNMAPKQYESYMTITDYKPSEKNTASRYHFFRKDNKMAGVIVDPPKQRGQVFLRNGDDMWMYLPRSKKITRIGAKETSMSGEASNADLLRIDLVKDYSGTFQGFEQVNGILCYKLELKAVDRSLAYDRVLYWISKHEEIPVKSEYYSLSGKKLKTMYFKNNKRFAGSLRPSVVEIINARNTAYKTVILLESMTERFNLGDNIFTPAYVKRGNLD
jgi:outer membrane lipoprotein-sorting protein